MFQIKVQEIQNLDQKICDNLYFNQNLLNNYELAKKELKNMYDSKGKEAMFRSKARWVEQGEKPTKYLFNLEKRDYDRKVLWSPCGFTIYRYYMCMHSGE